MADKPKMKPHIPPRIKDPIPKGDPGGPHTPGAKEKRRKEAKKQKKNEDSEGHRLTGINQ